MVFQEKLFEGDGGQDCPFSSNVPLDLLKPLVEPHLQSNRDLLVGCFQNSYPALLGGILALCAFYVVSLFCHASVMHCA